MTRENHNEAVRYAWQLTRNPHLFWVELCVSGGLAFLFASWTKMNACVVCNAPSEKKCSLCLSVYYCCREHQKQDWKRHKARCICYKIEENVDLGRHLVASRRLATGEEVLREAPLVSGPLQVTPPVCLGCYSLLTELGSLECPKCGWPMCSMDCAKSPQHYPECKITSQCRGTKVKIQTFQMTHPSYESLTVLRCLYLKNERPKLWEKLNRLQSHCEERKLTEKYEHDKRTIAQFIQRFFKFTDFSEEEILRIIGIININGHEVPISGHDFVSVYDTASYLEHNCQANCSKSFSAAGELVVRAARTIEAGEHLSICYTDPLWGTASRRHHLMETKFFSCVCRRCLDRTELDTHFSSLKCTTGSCRGFVVPTDALRADSTPWTCLTCHSSLPAEAVATLIADASARLSVLDKTSLKDCKKYIEEFERRLHHHHYLLTDVKLAVTQILDAGVGNLSEEDLALKLRYCRQLNKLITTLVPAENRCRGVLLFGFHAALAEIGRRKSNRGEIDPADLRNNLLECKEILSEAYQLLRHEPDILPEGQIALQAKANLKDIERILQTLHATMGDALL